MTTASRRRPPTLAVRVARFTIYGAITSVVVARHAPAIRDSARALVSPGVYLPSVPCIPCALTLGAVLVVYLFWLFGATLGGWTMPVWTHAVPILGLLGTLVAGPLQPEKIPEQVDMTRAPDLTVYSAMTELGRALERGEARCDDAAGMGRVLEDPARVRLPGYRRHGRLSRFRVRVVPSASGISQELLATDLPPTVVVSCSADHKRYWLSGVSMDLDTGSAQILRDGVGRVATVVGSTGGETR